MIRCVLLTTMSRQHGASQFGAVQMAKTKKEQTQRIAGFKELGKQMDEMSKQMEAYNAQMATMKRRLQELEAVQSS